MAFLCVIYLALHYSAFIIAFEDYDSAKGVNCLWYWKETVYFNCILCNMYTENPLDMIRIVDCN